MIVVFIRTVIIYIVLLTVMRFMGKRQIGEMQPFEFIVALLIAELACIPMADVSIPLLYGIVAIIAIFIVHQFMSLIEASGQTMKKIISGKPSLVINKDGVDFNELKKNNLDVVDLIEALRNDGYFSLDEIAYAIFEANGKLSAILKENVSQPNAVLPLLLVNNGKIMEKNLDFLQKDNSFIMDIIKQKKIKNLNKVGVLTIDNQAKVYLQEIGKSFKSFNLNEHLKVQW